MSTFLANEDEALARAMIAHLQTATSADWAVAYVRSSFFDVLAEPLDAFLARGGRLRLPTGSGQHLTQASALERLQRKGVAIRVYAAPGVTFHPKLYLFGNGDRSVIVGSANLSAGALSSNVEAAAEIRGSVDPAFTERARAWFEQVWERAAPLTVELLRWFREHERAEDDDDFARLVREEQERYWARRDTSFEREDLFTIGRGYTRVEIDRRAKVGTQRGISYPVEQSGRPRRCVVIVGRPDDSPYADRILDNGQRIIYTGEGLRGDQTLTAGNRALARQRELGFPLHVFLKRAPNAYIYLGQYAVESYTTETQSDANGHERMVYVFDLRRLG